MSAQDTTYVRFRPPSSLCTTGLQAHILTGVFLQLLRTHFSSAENIEEPRLRGCLWVPKSDDPVTPDPERSMILIEPVYRWDTRQLQARPAVIVRRNDLQPRNRVGIAMNEEMQLAGFDSDGLPEAGREYYLPFQGSHSLFCVAKDGGAAELLSTEVSREFYQFARPIVQEFGFEFLELAHIGAVSRLEESFEHFAVPVTLRYGFYDHWKVTKLAPRFSGVSLNTIPAD
jgi:hypothetical protein